MDYVTKDSGARQTWPETGAQRDTQAGKGRYDMFPWLVMGDFVAQWDQNDGESWTARPFPTDWILNSVSRFMGASRPGPDYLYAPGHPDNAYAVACILTAQLGGLETALPRLAGVFERGAVKYEARNWEKGIPVCRYVDSLVRHTIQAASGQEDEDHLAQALWNALCCLQTLEMIRLGILPASLDDRPDYHERPRDVQSGAGMKHPFLDFEPIKDGGGPQE